MGYASTVPYLLFRSTRGTATTLVGMLSNPGGDVSIGSILTPVYTMPITHCYATVRFHCLYESSGALNYVFGANQYLELSGGGVDIDAGKLSQGALRMLANGVAYNVEYRFNANIVGSIKPNTTYACTIKNGQAFASSLVFFHPEVILDFYYIT